MEDKNNGVKSILTANIRKYRKALNLTQDKLAELSGLNSIADIEAGRSNPNLSTIIKIANSLDVEVWELFKDHNTSETKPSLSKTATKQMIRDLLEQL